MSCRKSYQHININVIFWWLLRLYGILSITQSNLFTVRNGRRILFLSFCLKWCKAAIYGLEDGNWNAARVIWCLSSMYSHMCQDLADGEMRRWGWLRGWQSKRSRVWIDADGRARRMTAFLAGARVGKTLRRFLPFPRNVSKRLRSDMYANLGDDEDILWGSEWALWWCKWKRRPLKVEGGGCLLHMHWGRSKPFRRSHIYIAISPELWEPGNPVFGLFLNKEGLVEVLWHN